MALDIKIENFELIGADEVARLFDRLLTSDTDMDVLVRKLISKELRAARSRISKELAKELESDPRKAALAVKSSVYKQLFGGNVSILAKRRASSTRVTLNRERTLEPNKPGGNRRRVSTRTKQLESYYGSDRGFILRFLNAGTTGRHIQFTPNGKRKEDKWNKHPNTGNRSALTGNNMFANTAPRHMVLAVETIIKEVENYIASLANG